ncbi:MAG: sensor histidine kinase, partial [Lentisphaerae bacterium]
GANSFIRVAFSMKSFLGGLRGMKRNLFYLFSVVLCLSLIGSYFVTRQIEKPLEQIQAGAARYARGDLNFSIHLDSEIEIFQKLAEHFNTMRAQLRKRFSDLERQRNEVQAILTAMQEGVIAVGHDEKIQAINPSARAMLCRDCTNCDSRSASEISNPEITQALLDTIRSGQPDRREIQLRNEDGDVRYIQVTLSPLLPEKGQGAVAVLNDITRLRHLEEVRKDFVANVSHELKTPITAIQGFAETLLDETDQTEVPQEFIRFVAIIKRQADRLRNILEDLLTLASLETMEQIEHQIEMREIDAADLLREATDLCQWKATEKKIRIHWECPSSLKVVVNPHLMEQALVNLLDNAIKYSPEERDVAVRVRTENEHEVCIEVEDHGTGIPAQDIPRLFERFYRVDKARSRELGGTGLGLAIVKH